MNLVFGIVFAAAAIAAMIVIRIIAYESALKARLKASGSDACNSASCFGGCGSFKSQPTSGPTPDSETRSAPHAS
jgi:hypothetical protein